MKFPQARHKQLLRFNATNFGTSEQWIPGPRDVGFSFADGNFNRLLGVCISFTFINIFYRKQSGFCYKTGVILLCPIAMTAMKHSIIKIDTYEHYECTCKRNS